MNNIDNCKIVPITELLECIIDNRGKSCPTCDNGFPLIATNCIKHSSIYPTFENIRYVSDEILHSWFRAKLKPNDILFVNKGTPGRVCLVPNPISFCAAQDMIGLRADKKKIYYKYLFAVLRSQFIQDKISNYHVGIAIPHFKKSDMNNLLIPLPNMDLQIKIGDLYYEISEKIEINNKVNFELESMAKTIYDYWFLQFEFPNEEGKPYKSSGGKMIWNEELEREIPESWGAKKLGEIFEFVKGKIPDKIEKKGNSNFEEYLTIDVVNGGKAGYCSQDSMVLTDGEVLMVMDGAASSDVYVGNKGIVGSTFCKLEIKDKNIDDNFLFVIMKKFEVIFKSVNTGSTVPHANKNYINNFKIALPCEFNTMQRLQKSISLFINTISINKKENQQLLSLRDFLLPLLMNGQVGFKEDISVKEIEGDREEVAASVNRK